METKLNNNLFDELILKIEEVAKIGEEIAEICKRIKAEKESKQAPENPPARTDVIPDKYFSFAQWLIDNKIKNATSIEAITGMILKMEKANATYPYEVLNNNGAYTAEQNARRLQIYHWNKANIEIAASISNRIRNTEVFTTLGQAAIGRFIFDLLELGWQAKTINAFQNALQRSTNAGMNRIKDELRKRYMHKQQSARYDYEALVLMFNCFVGNVKIVNRYNFVRLPSPILPKPHTMLDF